MIPISSVSGLTGGCLVSSVGEVEEIAHPEGQREEGGGLCSQQDV